MGFISIIKPTLDNKKSDLPFQDIEYCINCAELISKNQKICNNCGHDQDLPLIKEKIDIETAVNFYLFPFYNSNFYDAIREFIKSIIQKKLGKNINEANHNVIYNEIFLMRLSLTYILFIDHFSGHQKISELTELYTDKIIEILMNFYKNEDIDSIYAIFISRMKQYGKAFRFDDPVKAISKMLQFIIEKTVFEYENKDDFNVTNNLCLIAQDMAGPGVPSFMPCFSYVSKHIITDQIILSKWEIV